MIGLCLSLLIKAESRLVDLDLSATEGFIHINVQNSGISPASDKPRSADFQTAAESSRGIEP